MRTAGSILEILLFKLKFEKRFSVKMFIYVLFVKIVDVLLYFFAQSVCLFFSKICVYKNRVCVRIYHFVSFILYFFCSKLDNHLAKMSYCIGHVIIIISTIRVSQDSEK